MNTQNGRTNLARAALVFAGLSGTALAAPNLLVNGDFETVPADLPVSEDGVTVLPAGTTALPGWTVTGTTVDHLRGDYWQNASGACSIDLDGLFSTGGIRQSFPTEIGQTYRLAFAFSGNPDASDEPVKKLRVTVAASTQDYSIDVTDKTRTAMGWVDTSFLFTADAAVTTVEFASSDLGTHGRGPTVDNVRVTAVPEPAVVTLVPGAALLATAGRRRRRPV